MIRVGLFWVLRGRRLWCWSWGHHTPCSWRSSVSESSWSWCGRIFCVEALLVSSGRVERVGDLQSLACLWQASVLHWAVPYEMPCLSAVEASRIGAVGLDGFHAVLHVVHPLLHLRRGCSRIKLHIRCLITAEVHRCLLSLGLRRLFSYRFEWSPLWLLNLLRLRISSLSLLLIFRRLFLRFSLCEYLLKIVFIIL